MSRSFSKIVSIAFAITLVVGIARTSFAQEEDKDMIRPITKQGSTAFMFELGGIGTFNFGGPGIMPGISNAAGAEYYIADGTSLFVLAGFNTTSGSDSIASTVSAKRSYTNFGIGAGVQLHCRPLWQTSPYWGGMIAFGSSSTDDGQSGNAENKSSNSSFSIAALAGFDWYFTHGLALGGEMHLGFTSSSASSTGEGTTINEQGSSTIALYTGGSVHLIVHI